MIQSGIFNEIKNNEYFSTLLANDDGTLRIYPHRVPAGMLNTNDEFITYSMISAPKDRQIGYTKATFQINCISKSYDKVNEMANNLEALFGFYQGNLGGKFKVDRVRQLNKYDMFDNETGLYMMPVEVKFIYR